MRKTRIRGAAALLTAAAVGLVPAVVGVSAAAQEPTVILSSDFEDGSASPWYGRGAATVAVTDADAHGGTNSLSVTGRTANWHGVATNVLGLFTPGETYTVSGWVKLVEPGTTTAKFTVAETPEAYTQVTDPVTVTADEWVQMTGSYTMPEDLTGAELYIEADDATASFLVDDVEITGIPATSDETVLANDFEGASVAPWGPRGPVTLAVTADDARTGSQSMSVTGRTADWNGPATDALALFDPGTEYAVSAWIKLAPGTEGTAQAHFTVDAPDASNPFEWVGGAVDVTADEWVEIGGTYTMAEGLGAASLYIEASAIDGVVPQFLVDDVLITGPPSTEAVIESDFEEALAPWGARGDGTNPTVTRSDAAAHGGSWSALVADRTEAWHGIGADVTTLFQAGSTYHISGWVKLAEGEDPADLRLSIQRDSGGSTTFSTIATITGVTSGEWVQVEADYTHAAADSALLYFESASALVSFHLDDVLVTRDIQEVQTDIPPLKDVVPWPIGVAIDERETVGAGAQLVTMHYDQITAENYMKPESIQPTEGNFTFAAADQLVDFAVANDLRVYGHTLVWHSQTPDWFFQDGSGEPLTNSPEDQEILRARLEAHIFAIADHYRSEYGEFGTPGNPIVAFDVVNEPIGEGEADGLRRSPWYNVLGEQYLDLAFQYASEAFNGGDTVDPPVKLFINDYNTELPAKREAMYSVVQRLLDRGVPVDGIGSQLHVSLAQPVSQIAATLDRFSELGLLQAVTELDVVIDAPVTQEKIVQQGYYYADLFDVLREQDLFAVTLWGPYDSRSWRAAGEPLPFDGDLQAKPAYWGIVDRDELPALTRTLNVHAGEVTVADGPDALEWLLLPLTEVSATEAGVTGFQLRWSPEGVVAYVQVMDATDDGGADTVDLFLGDSSLSVGRDGTTSGEAQVSEIDGGYLVVAELPMTGLSQGDEVAFDIRITDGATGDRASWNDLSHNQEDGERLGVLTLVEPVAYVEIPEALSTPTVDGEIDGAWADAPTVTTEVQVEGTDGATGDFRLLWSEGALYVLAEVTDPVLNNANSNPWEQDSVEVFVNPGNTKAGAYGPDDGQYRISYTNDQSIGGEAGLIDNLTSATSVTEDGYLVEASIQLAGDVEPGVFVGLEFQVNDASADAVRTSVRTWTDPTGRSYQDTSRFGVGQLVGPTFVPDPDLDLATRIARAGEELGIELSGYLPGSTVQISLEGWPWGRTAVIGEITVDDTGAAAEQVTIPDRTKIGIYRVVGRSGDLSDGELMLILPRRHAGGFPWGLLRMI